MLIDYEEKEITSATPLETAELEALSADGWVLINVSRCVSKAGNAFNRFLWRRPLHTEGQGNV